MEIQAESLEFESQAQKWHEFLRMHMPQLWQTEFSGWVLKIRQSPVLVTASGLSLEIDFDQNAKDYQRKGRGRKEVFARALGIDKSCHRVLDLSMGMGIDAVFAVGLGFHVSGIERNPLMYLFLQSAIQRTKRSELQKIELFHGQVSQLVRDGKLNLDQFDTLYFDPMYTEVKNKTALPRKEMQVFRTLVGPDDDAAETLAFVRENFSGRIVVKRPIKAAALGTGPIHQFAGTTVRYDLYRGGI